MMAIQSNGTLWAWGINSQGQLGLNTTTGISSPVQVGALSIWVQVNAGQGFCTAIQSNGTLWSWGCNSFGQLGINNNSTTLIVSTPVQVGSLSNWSRVAVATGYALAIQSDGTLWVWGNNSYANGTYGNLGLTPTANSVTKITYGL
jgi:alpha-tubulin suppressor-like RCC1 family protein